MIDVGHRVYLDECPIHDHRDPEATLFIDNTVGSALKDRILGWADSSHKMLCEIVPTSIAILPRFRRRASRERKSIPIHLSPPRIQQNARRASAPQIANRFQSEQTDARIASSKPHGSSIPVSRLNHVPTSFDRERQ